MTIDETLNEDSPVYNLFYQVTDPRTNMPALTTLMYKVCKNDPVRFDEATKIVALFMLAAYEKGKENPND